MIDIILFGLWVLLSAYLGLGLIFPSFPKNITVTATQVILSLWAAVLWISIICYWADVPPDESMIIIAGAVWVILFLLSFDPIKDSLIWWWRR